MTTQALIPGGYEWLWILLAVLVIFGGKKLPELARAMGSSITQFKSGLKEEPDSKERISSSDEDDESD